MIYIATNVHGRGVKIITAFDSRHDFLCYADEVLSCHNNNQMIRAKASNIDRICEALYDNGPGTGARHHHRISRIDAMEHLRNGARAVSCWNLAGVWS